MPAGHFALLASICLLVVVSFALLSEPSGVDRGRSVSGQVFNQMVDGFRAHQLNLKRAVPPGLAALDDPYDAAANARFLGQPHDLGDLSYYRGKLYAYFGPAPALVLFWPCVALTGRYLSLRAAVVIFCSLGYLAAAGLLMALWRRHLPRVGAAWVAAGLLALGMATGIPAMLQSPGFHEVALSCGHAFTMAALAALWPALHRPARRGRWLAGASLLYGLAVSARPSLVVGAGILLLPIALEWRTGSAPARPGRLCALFAAAVVPIALVGAGMMAYNALRFQSPFEFGESYMLAGDPHGNTGAFNPGYAGFNLRMYFLEALRWGPRFPFVHLPLSPPIPPGHRPWRGSIGILPNFPIVLVALAWAAPFRRRLRPDAALLHFAAALAIVAATSVLLLACYAWTFARYEVDFLPALVLLAVSAALVQESRRPSPVFRGAFLCLVVWSVAIGLLVCVPLRSDQWVSRGTVLMDGNRLSDALASDRTAIGVDPDSPVAHAAAALVLEKMGRGDEALAECDRALGLVPQWAEGHTDVGTILAAKGRQREAIGQFREALRLNPGLSDAHNNLGIALARSGQLPEAALEFERARQTGRDSPELETNVGNVDYLAGRMSEAAARYEQALRLDPGYAGARENLAAARRALAERPPVAP